MQDTLYCAKLCIVLYYTDPSIHPSIHVSIHCIHSSIHLLTNPSIHPFTYPFVYPSTHPCIYSSIHLFIPLIRSTHHLVIVCVRWSTNMDGLLDMIDKAHPGTQVRSYHLYELSFICIIVIFITKTLATKCGITLVSIACHVGRLNACVSL